MGARDVKQPECIIGCPRRASQFSPLITLQSCADVIVTLPAPPQTLLETVLFLVSINVLYGKKHVNNLTFVIVQLFRVEGWTYFHLC
jgi:hypothetical protein